MKPSPKAIAPRDEICESYMTNFKRCLRVATHIERCPNGVDHFCTHHAEMRKRQGGVVEPIKTK